MPETTEAGIDTQRERTYLTNFIQRENTNTRHEHAILNALVYIEFLYNDAIYINIPTYSYRSNLSALVRSSGAESYISYHKEIG